MSYIRLLRVGVLLFPFLALAPLSGCPGPSGSGNRSGAVNEEPDRHGADQGGRTRGGGMMGGSM
jgi:hypothetical protein